MLSSYYSVVIIAAALKIDHDAEHRKNSIRDARTTQPGEIIFNTMKYRNSETVQRSGYFQSSVSYIKLQTRNMTHWHVKCPPKVKHEFCSKTYTKLARVDC